MKNKRVEKDESKEVDWSLVRHLAQSGNMDELLGYVKNCMKKHKGNHFKYMKRGIQQNGLNEMEKVARGQLLVQCFSLVMMKDLDRNPSAINHLVVELMADNFDLEVAANIKPVTAGLFAQCCSKKHARIAAKVAPIFHLMQEDLPAELSMIDYLKDLMNDPNTYTPGVGLLMHFPQYLQLMDLRLLFRKLLECGHESLCERWAANLDESAKIHFIEECLQQTKMKIASSAVRKFDLIAKYPYLERQYTEATLIKLLNKGLWGPAAIFAGEDRQFQEMIVRKMALEGQALLAQQYTRMFNLPETIIDIDPDAIAVEAAVRAQKYQHLAIPFENVFFVDSAEKIMQTGRWLANVAAIGLDVEWKPEGKGARAKASILQVAIKEHVIIFDLLAIGNSPELNTVLSLCLGSEETTVVGFGIKEDLARLAWSHPGQSCFKEVHCVVDLQQAWGRYSSKNRIQTVSAGQTVGLSHVVERVLGKPIDKSMQVSNWELRPLTEPQMRYAAQDAHVLLLVHDKMVGDHGRGLGAELHERFAYTYKYSGQNQGVGERSSEPAFRGVEFPGLKVEEKTVSGNASPSNQDSGRPQATPHVHLCPSTSEQTQGPPERVGARLSECGLPHAFQLIHGDLRTCEGAASALAVQQAQIVKSIAIMVKGVAILAVLRGDCKVNLDKIARGLGKKRRRVRFALENECIDAFGYAPGTMPPFGHASEVKVFVDPSLEAFSSDKGGLYCGSGTRSGIVVVTYSQLLTLSQAKVLDLTLESIKGSENGEESQGDGDEKQHDMMTANWKKTESSEVMFTLDTMLGRLCRWLRAMGVDAEYVPQGTRRMDIPAAAKEAMDAGRVFLTRNFELATRKDAGVVYLLRSDNCEAQLKEISQHFGIRCDENPWLIQPLAYL